MAAKKPPAIPSTEQARKRLTVAQLKTILRSVHLSIDGLKADLLKRLEDPICRTTTKTTEEGTTTTKTTDDEDEQEKRSIIAEKEKEEEDKEEEGKGGRRRRQRRFERCCWRKERRRRREGFKVGEIDDDAKDSKMAKEPTTKKAKVNDDADGKEKTGGKSVENLKTTEVKPLVPLAQIGAVRAPVRETFGNSVRKLPGGCRRETREARV